jgi:hypothetical protein
MLDQAADQGRFLSCNRGSAIMRAGTDDVEVGEECVRRACEPEFARSIAGPGAEVGLPEGSARSICRRERRLARPGGIVKGWTMKFQGIAA